MDLLLNEELKRGKYETAVLSNEHCSSRLVTDAEIQRLRDNLIGHFERIVILVYVRRQDDLLLSGFSTAVKSGSTRQLALPGPAAALGYDYAILLSRWSKIFGRENMICRRFERSSLPGGDVVDDFLSAIGIEPGSELVRPTPANESLGAASLEFLRLFNRSIPRFSNQSDLHPLRDNIVRLLRELPQGPLPTLPAEELARFMTRFRESNRQVAVEYFGGERQGSDDPLFAPRADGRERLAAPWLTVERAVEIAAHLWECKQTELNQLANRARHKDRKSKRAARSAIGGH